jgi:hypothetical protein
MTDSAPSLRALIKSDLIALGSVSYMLGVFTVTTYFARGNLVGWILALGAVISAGGAIFIGRRIFSRIP